MIILSFFFGIHSGASQADLAYADPSAAMQARYLSVCDQLGNNDFGQPMHLVSDSSAGHTSADLSAVLDYPFDMLVDAFNSADSWCEIMMLHLNIKFCKVGDNGKDQLLTVYVGRKHEQPLESAHRGDYLYQVAEEANDYFQVILHAEKGPFRTRNYRILLEAVPLNPQQTFVHFAYAYEFGALARTAKSLYFLTAGRDKVGFTTVDNDEDGRPEHVGGLRGALERNIMRYYLALKAHLNGMSAPPSQRIEKRLNEWFALTEMYPLQLRELEKSEYLLMKRKEFERFKTGAGVISPAGPIW